MAKFVELNEAARLLNVTPDELKEMRQRGEIAGVSTGGGWKFKQEEIDRVLSERDGDSSSSAMFSDEFNHLIPQVGPDEEASGDQDSASILVSDEALGKSAETTSSTIIGKNRVDLATSDSDIKLAGESSIGAAASDLDMLSVDSMVLSGSELNLNKSGSGTGDLTPDAAAASALGADSLALNDDALALGADDDLVLGGSDIMLNPSGSGINLANPHDSGVSLEEPLPLGGSQIDSLELPEDSDMITLGDADSDDGDPDRATQLKTDDGFMLSPMNDELSDESSDSGSQVIALVDSEQFDESAATMLGAEVGAQPILSADGGETVGQQLGGFDTGAAVTATMSAPATQYVAVPMPDVPYSVWNVLGLLCIFGILTVTGMLMIDLLRNMWAFDSNTQATTAVMDGIISALRLQ